MDMSGKAPSEHFLQYVDRLVDWGPLTPLVKAIGDRVNAEVPPGALKMLLLARWYGLSESALLEACQDRISFRKFLGLPLGDSPDDVRLAEAFRRHATHAGMEAQNLVHAIEAQLLAKGFSIRPGMWSDASVLPAAPKGGAENPPLSETSLFQPGEIADLIKQGEAAMVRGGAMMVSSGSVTLTTLTPVLSEAQPVQAFVEWPWGAVTELTDRLNIGRQVGFSPYAPELEAYLHVSRKHAELMVCAEGVWVRDLRSRNGTYVNNERLPGGQGFLVDTDARIRFGPYCVVELKIKK
jgi:FHA domain-containing protein/transposase-like protein DUF772